MGQGGCGTDRQSGSHRVILMKREQKCSLVIATRSSPLALAQAELVKRALMRLFPGRSVELREIRTTGDHLQTASLANPDASLPKGLFTKELEVALLEGSADLAVHSLKDLPTTLPDGLELISVLPREDVRDVLIYRDLQDVGRKPPAEEWSPGDRVVRGFRSGLRLNRLPSDAVIGTSSTRRAAIITAECPGIRTIPLRGSVGTRLAKLAGDPRMDATILAAAGLRRLGLFVGPGSRLVPDPRRTLQSGVAVPEGLLGSVLDPEELLPAAGQGAIGIEIASSNAEARNAVHALNHRNTWMAVTAERAFLRGVGGGCQSPIAAYARIVGHQIHLRAAVLAAGGWKKAEIWGASGDAEKLGAALALRVL